MIDETISSSELFPDNFAVFRKDININVGGVCTAIDCQI